MNLIFSSFSVFHVQIDRPRTCRRVCVRHHEAPVDLQMAEPARTSAVLRSVGAGVRRRGGKNRHVAENTLAS